MVEVNNWVKYMFDDEESRVAHHRVVSIDRTVNRLTTERYSDKGNFSGYCRSNIEHFVSTEKPEHLLRLDDLSHVFYTFNVAPWSSYKDGLFTICEENLQNALTKIKEQDCWWMTHMPTVIDWYTYFGKISVDDHNHNSYRVKVTDDKYHYVQANDLNTLWDYCGKVPYYQSEVRDNHYDDKGFFILTQQFAVHGVHDYGIINQVYHDG